MSKTPTTPRGYRIFFRALVAMVVLAVIVVVGFRWLRDREMTAALDRFERVTAAHRARGEPLGLFDREATEHYPDNGAAAIVVAVDALRYRSGDQLQWTDGPWNLEEDELRTLDDARRDALAAFVAEHESFFVELDAAASRAAIAFPTRRGAGGMLEWAPVEDMLLVKELLQARAIFGATEEQRVAAIETTLRVGRRWRPRSTLEWLLAAHFLDSGAREICAGLASGRIDADMAAERLAPSLVDDTIDGFPDLVRAEGAWLLSLHDAMIDLPGVDDDSNESMSAGLDFERMELALSFAGPQIVDAASEVFELSDQLSALPTDDHVLLAEAVDAATAALREPDRSLLPWSQVRRLLGSGLAAVAAKAPRSLARVDTRLRLTRIAVAATVTRDRTGAWPATLDKLAPAFSDGVPMDPRTGAPFRYEIGDDGALRVSGADDVEGSDDAVLWVVPR